MPEQSNKLIIGIPEETYPGERRVAVIPDAIPSLNRAGLDVIIESGAGEAAGFLNKSFTVKGGRIVEDRKQLFAEADVILQVRGLGANPDRGRSDLDLMRPGQVLISMQEPLSEIELNEELARGGVITFAMELIPRITRAQSMDVLSSMASIAGYKAVLLAAEHLPKIFPMMMTAAGTITPAKVFVVGVGVAGLQAIATAKRLGAAVKAYDIRPAVKEQVNSLGADFVELELETGKTEDTGGYARAMDDKFYRKQREMMKKVISASDVVITTAAVPGKKAPVLVTTDSVVDMAPGSVIVDLAAEHGGNCEFTRPGEIIDFNNITVIGLLNLSSTIPLHASQMYSRNITTFLLHLVKEGEIDLNLDDQIIRETLVARDGEIVNEKVLEVSAKKSEIGV
jgi:NAD(P) transhydrogenase subunit alpha